MLRRPLSALVVVLGGACLLLTGIRPGALPFNPGARFSDAATSHFPAALFLRESLREGDFPVWRDTIMLGQPFAANPLNKTAYPLQYLVLILPPALHLGVMVILHLALAGWGMWTWARALGLSESAAALSALAYALAPRMIGHTGAGHLDVLYALAWSPWLLWTIRRAIVGEDSWVVVMVRTALLAALVFIADVRVSLFALTFAGVYTVYEVVGKRHNAEEQRNRGTKIFKRLLRLALAGIPFVLLTAAVTMPLAWWRPYLSRAAMTPADAGVFSLEIGHLLGVILPAHQGNIETLTYLGLPVLVLAGLAILSAPRKFVFWLAVLALAVWYALGINGLLWPTLVRIFPALLWFRVPSRAWFVIALVAPLLAGYGLDTLLAWAANLRAVRSEMLKRLRLLAGVGLIAALACGGFSLVMVTALAWTVGASVLVGGGALFALLLVGLTGKLKPDVLATALLVLTFADLTWTGVRWLEWRGEDDWLDPYRPLAQKLIELDAARIYSPTYTLPQQVAEAYHLRLFGGVDPFQLRGINEVIRQGSGVNFDGYSVVQPPLIGIEGDDLSQANRDAVPDTQVLADWGVSHIVAAYPIEHERLESLDTVGDAYIYANLDYSGSSSDWTADVNLPDDDTIARLNQLTLNATVASGVGFIVCLVILLIPMLNHRNAKFVEKNLFLFSASLW